MKRGLFLIAAWLAPLLALALGPHEILLLLNTNSADSVRIGETYARLRKVPQANVVRLSVPEAPAMTADAFRRTILEPARTEAAARGVAPHVLAWVYAPGFPYRIQGDPPLSLTGLTLLGGDVPPTNAWMHGNWKSPFYAGPDSPGGHVYESRSLDMLTEWMGAGRPVPGWVLAFTGERGLSVDEAGAMLVRGIDSDSTRPEGVFCLITNRDVRTQTRAWQFRETVEELESMGFRAKVTNALPRGGPVLAGLLMGSAEFDPSGVRLVSGAWVDNMTSFGAAFDVAAQTKCTAWLAAGAAASGGAVTEPWSAWSKFPHARLFVHAASGCTALESFYQATRQPLQYLPLGDPLAAPWKPRAEVAVDGLADSVAPTGRVLRVSVNNGGTVIWTVFKAYVDGREAGGGRLDEPWVWNPAGLAPGPHEFRIVARSAGVLRHQAFLVRPVIVQAAEGAP